MGKPSPWRSQWGGGSPCWYETHSPSSWKILKGSLSCMYSGSISRSNQVQKGALCQFWKIQTGQYIVSRIYRHEAELSLCRHLSVRCSQKALAGAVDFCIYYFLSYQFYKIDGISRTSCSTSFCFFFFSLPPPRNPPAMLSIQLCRVCSLCLWKVIKAGPIMVMSSVPSS